MDYKNGKIYRLVCNKTGLVYYGSTTQPLHKRKNVHKSHYTRFISAQGKYNFMTSYDIIKNEDFTIVLVEDYPCDRKEQLLARERYYIENNECINKNIPTRSNKEYYADNRDRILAQKKEYQALNMDSIRHKKHERYIANRDIVNCLCGGQYQTITKASHDKSKRHQKYLELIKNVISTA